MPEKWCVVNKDGIIVNIIVSTPDFAGVIGARPWYEDAQIGAVYDYIAPDPAPDPPTEMEQMRADLDYLLMLQEE